VARERERRLALLEQRKQRRQTNVPLANEPPVQVPEPVAAVASAEPPSGFDSHEQWRQALDVADAVAQVLRDVAGSAVGFEGSARTMGATELSAALVEAVFRIPPIQAVSLLWDGHRAGLPVLPEHQAAFARALLDRTPTMLSADNADMDADGLEAWQLYADSERIWHREIGVERQRRLIENLPLSVVDDLIDAGRMDSRAFPDSGEDHLYLLARLAPTELDREGLLALGWHEELTRREFNVRIAQGDIAVLDDLQALTSGQRRLAVQLREVRDTGEILPELLEQRWLWPVLERLAPTSASIRGNRQYGRWLAVRRTLRNIRGAHSARLCGDEKKYNLLLQTAWRNATSLRDAGSTGGWEARNFLAYLTLIRSGSVPHYDEALRFLEPVSQRGPSEEHLPPAARRRLAANRELLRTPKEQHKSAYMINPYVVLGVRDGFPEWKERWRKLRASLDPEGEARINEARDAIQAHERGRAATDPFALPLMPEKWEQTRPNKSATARDGTPMPRRTPAPTAEEQDVLRARAARGIVRAAGLHVGLPDRS
jgi:hypothetical protein